MIKTAWGRPLAVVILAALCVEAGAQSQPEPTQLLSTTTTESGAIDVGNHWYEMARGFYKDRNYAKGNAARTNAIHAYEKALEINPGSFNAWVRLGDIHNEHWMSGGDQPAAVDAFKHALALKPDDGSTLNRLGIAYVSLDQLPEAAAAFEGAARKFPADPIIQFNLGYVYTDMGRNDDARNIYDKLLIIDKARAQELLDKMNKSSRLSSTGARPQSFPNPKVELVWIKPGSFQMGQGKGKSGRTVNIKKGYYFGKYPVTLMQWQTVMGDNPTINKDCGSCPVIQVNWNDAQAFIARLNSMHDGYRYRLPSEAEWEYAYRGGTTGDTYAEGVIGWDSHSSLDKAQPVGHFPPNPFGLYEMGGHVQEWCMDWYLDDLGGAPTDGSPVLKAIVQRYRVQRGTSYRMSFADSPATHRDGRTPDSTDFHTGFRVAADKAG